MVVDGGEFQANVEAVTLFETFKCQEGVFGETARAQLACGSE